MDAAVKVVALVNSLGMGDPILLSDVAVEARRRPEPRMVLHAGCTQRLSGVFNSPPKRTWYALACRACAASLRSARLRQRPRGARCGWWLARSCARTARAARAASRPTCGPRSSSQDGHPSPNHPNPNPNPNKVRPEELEPGDPLHGLAGADAALTFYTDRLAPVTTHG